jgi:hypothetical protein
MTRVIYDKSLWVSLSTDAGIKFQVPRICFSYEFKDADTLYFSLSSMLHVRIISSQNNIMWKKQITDYGTELKGQQKGTKIMALQSSETSVHVCQWTWCNIPQDFNLLLVIPSQRSPSFN